MKPITPNDPLDDLIAAALHGDLTPVERAQFESRLATDPAAQAAYEEAQAMHDLLEKTHKTAQPDAAFEQRMVSGVRRKIQTDQHRETAWESVLALWRGVKGLSKIHFPPVPWFGSFIAIFCIIFVLAGVALGPITNGIKKAKQSPEYEMRRQMELAKEEAQSDAGESSLSSLLPGSQVKGVFSTITSQLAVADANGTPSQVQKAPQMPINQRLANIDRMEDRYKKQLETNPDDKAAADRIAHLEKQKQVLINSGAILSGASTYTGLTTIASGQLVVSSTPPAPLAVPTAPSAPATTLASSTELAAKDLSNSDNAKSSDKPQLLAQAAAASAAPEPPAPQDDRKLIRNAQLDLEVKSFQAAFDQITTLTKSAGGYVDTSNSQKGGNGKLQGTVVVKVLPQNLDGFLLKLRDLGEVQNQSVSTDDVTKDYFDTQARLVNSQKMEGQLQELLKRENGKVSDLLAVERELGRVRGEIEGMQGQLKLYDFQVQYATVTMQLAETDLKQTAAYLLKEQDDFSLFATDVESTFQTARKTADDFKAQVLVANLNHNSGSDVSATLVVSVPPDQIEAFLAQVRNLGRVANFVRDTKRVAKDGGDSNQPADQSMTEKDKVMVNVSIRSDDETRKQVAMTVVTKSVDDALDKAKAAAMAQAGTSILASSLNKTPQGQSTAQLTVRVPGKEYAALKEAYSALGRTSSLSVQRNDNAGPGANGDDAPVIISLSLTDDDAPIQTTEMSVIGSDIDSQSQQIKKDAAATGVEVKASSFVRQPDGTEMAQMTFQMPMSKYASFVETLNKLGKVESLTVRRADRPDETRTDDNAPAQIELQLHNERGIVADDNGLFATLRRTFGEGADALFGSIRVIGVLIAFVLPWVFAIGVIAWVARRIYVWRKSK